MSGKASDAVLRAIFDLVDTDNNRIIGATELTAARSALSAANTSTTARGLADIFSVARLSYAEGLAKITSNTNLSLSNDQVIANLLKEIAQSNAKMSQTSSSAVTVVSKGSSSRAATVTAAAGLGLLAFFAFSDSRTKKNITHAKTLDNGINLYDYNYKEPYASMYGSDRKRGVMAQEIKDQYPDAVNTASNGMYTVDYSKLPVPSEMLKFAKGGILQGASHANGGIKTLFGELEGNEAIINKNSTREFTPLLSAINVAGGGVAFDNAGENSKGMDKLNLIDYGKLAQAVSSLPAPIVLVDDINTGQNNVAEVYEFANF
jgi:hypothetical protein